MSKKSKQKKAAAAAAVAGVGLTATASCESLDKTVSRLEAAVALSLIHI